jgi:hypothetical protein
MQQDFNDQSKPEGKRAGVKATEIADTIDAIIAYFEETKQGFPTLLDAIHNEGKEWKGNVSKLRGGDQEIVNSFFGQPAPKDVKDALAAKGIPAKAYGEPGFDEYRNEYFAMTQEMSKNGSAYWPGTPTSSLDDFRDILQFDSYREKLKGLTDGPATQLVERLDAFEGSRGSKHAALTGLMHETYAYIGNTPRDPSETFVPPPDVKTDYLNAFNHYYSTYIDWHPSDDLTQVTARISNGTGELPEKKALFLASEEAKAKAALVERGGIAADVHVELGKTYAQDAVVITMPMKEFTGRYLPIMRGEIEIDCSVPGSTFSDDVRKVKNYPGYEPGKAAFSYGSTMNGSDLLVSPATMKALSAEFPEPRLQDAAEALSFLRLTNSVVETREDVAVAPGRKESFFRLKPQFPKGDVHGFEGLYFDSCDIHNEVNRCLRDVSAGVNGYPPSEGSSRTQSKPDDVSFEHNGDMYIPRGMKYYQAALHMKHKYGVDYTWVFRDDEGKAKAAGLEKYVLSTSKLDPAIRAAAMADLNERLAATWTVTDLRSTTVQRCRARVARDSGEATVLRNKLRVGKPLSLKQ